MARSRPLVLRARHFRRPPTCRGAGTWHELECASPLRVGLRGRTMTHFALAQSLTPPSFLPVAVSGHEWCCIATSISGICVLSLSDGFIAIFVEDDSGSGFPTAGPCGCSRSRISKPSVGGYFTATALMRLLLLDKPTAALVFMCLDEPTLLRPSGQMKR